MKLTASIISLRLIEYHLSASSGLKPFLLAKSSKNLREDAVMPKVMVSSEWQAHVISQLNLLIEQSVPLLTSAQGTVLLMF
jgi:hypothetical protein